MPDYKEIKIELLDFLKNSNSPFNSFNYNESGIDTIVKLLALSEYRSNQAANVLLNESFFSSSETKPSLYSHAKRTQFIPRGITPATSLIDIKITAIDSNNIPTDSIIIIPRFTEISSTDIRKFYTTKSQLLSRNNDEFIGVVTAIEGKKIEELFQVDNSIILQKYILSDKNCDIKSIKVIIDNEEYFSIPDVEFSNINSDSKIYFIEKSFDDRYQLFFGNDVIGSLPETGKKVEISYISSQGDVGNGALFLNSPLDFSKTGWNIIANSKDSKLSFGGNSEESIESLKLGIGLASYQNSILSSPDSIKSFILSNFPSISSVSVFYSSGCIVIVLPNEFESGFKSVLLAELDDRTIPTIRIVFEPPVDIRISLAVAVISNKSIDEYSQSILTVIENYNTAIQKFNTIFSVSVLSKLICLADASLESVSITFTLESDIENEITPTENEITGKFENTLPDKSFVQFNKKQIPTISNIKII